MQTSGNIAGWKPVLIVSAITVSVMIGGAAERSVAAKRFQFVLSPLFLSEGGRLGFFEKAFYYGWPAAQRHRGFFFASPPPSPGTAALPLLGPCQ
jgi:hypothetical protein